MAAPPRLTFQQLKALNPGHFIQGYTADPRIHQQYYPSHRNRKQLYLPPVPIIMREWGENGIIPIRLDSVQHDGFADYNWQFSFIVPIGVPITVTTGCSSFSDFTHRNHERTNRRLEYLNREGGTPVATNDTGMHATYRAFDVPQIHVDWANNCFKLDNDVLRITEGVVKQPRPPVDGTISNPFQQVRQFHHHNAGIMIKQLSDEMVSFGIPGCFLAQVYGADDRLRWTLHVPPGFPITRWCGFISSVWGTSQNHQTDCPICRTYAPTYRANHVPMIQRMGYQFYKVTAAKINWCNYVIQQEETLRNARDGTASYVVPAKPSAFGFTWDPTVQHMEIYMLTAATYGDQYNLVRLESIYRTLYYEPHEAMMSIGLPPYAYIWSRTNYHGNLVNTGPFPMYWHYYPQGWAQFGRVQRMTFFLTMMTQAEYNNNGLAAPVFPNAPPPGPPPPAAPGGGAGGAGGGPGAGAGPGGAGGGPGGGPGGGAGGGGPGGGAGGGGPGAGPGAGGAGGGAGGGPGGGAGGGGPGAGPGGAGGGPGAGLGAALVLATATTPTAGAA